jgi:hypothetical protein
MEPPRDENLVVLSGLPVAAQQSQQVLSIHLLRKLAEQDPKDLSKIYVPVDGAGNTLGYVEASISLEPRDTEQTASLAIVRYPSSSDAEASIRARNNTIMDRNHVMVVEKLTTSAPFRAAESIGRIDDERLREIVALNFV